MVRIRRNMIKRIIHIDQNFPRRLSEQDSKALSHDNWGFDTVAATDINGNIATEGVGSISDVNDSTHVDQLYNNLQTTETQDDNLQNGQIRFSANVFNYIVHTEIDNIILKYDAPVVYAEGVEDEESGEFIWRSKYTVIKGYGYYHILFDILMHDPVGIDGKCYEAYVGNTLFGQVNRKNATNINATEKVDYAVLNSTWTKHNGSWSGTPDDEVWLSIHSNTEHFNIEKMEDPYSEDESAYKISVQLSGKGYTTNDINTSVMKFAAWKAVIENEQSTEDDIITAWNNCEGIKFKFFDVAGNITYWVMPHIDIEEVTIEDLYNLKKLTLEFINTRPADLFLGEDLIGRTTIKVTNPNSILASQPISIKLDKESIGNLYPSTYKLKPVVSNSNVVAAIATEDVGNIAESGWVVVHAEVDAIDFIDELAPLRTMIRNLLRVDGSLGEWIKECNDNTRKITLDPFVPQYLKETTNKNNAYYKFVKFTENYLNTMFKAYDKNCYISVLEAIARIGNFNDYTTIYKNLLDKYDNDHGDMLHLNFDDMTLLIDTERKELADETDNH